MNDTIKIIALNGLEGLVQEALRNAEAAYLQAELVDDEKAADLVVSNTIPDQSGPYVVIWEKHDIPEIEKKLAMSARADRHLVRQRCLRGLLLTGEVQKSSARFLEILKACCHEKEQREAWRRREAEILKDPSLYVKIGSLVEMGKKDSDQLEDAFSRPRFTALFIDEPMRRMLSQLSHILEEMGSSLKKVKTRNEYKELIEGVKKHRGLAEKEFDQKLVEKLNKIRLELPVRFEPILLTGGTGVGKTLIARWFHGIDSKDPRLPGEFKETNASGMTPELIESEIFGHVQGAFTDAYQDKPGLALLALGGVLFLDEIGDMPLQVQPIVMKFIEEGTFRPKGWDHQMDFYVPLLVVAATNMDLEASVEEGKFRKDLLARFRHRVHIPSIEERRESIPALVDIILQNPSVNRGKKLKYISVQALDKLKTLRYEENFRGLERVVRSAAVRALDNGLEIILVECVQDVSDQAAHQGQ